MNKDPYKKLANIYDSFIEPFNTILRKIVLKMHLPKEGMQVLEVGCGTGTLSVLAKPVVGDRGEVEGIDIAPKMIAKAHEKAKKAHLNVNFRIASIDDLPYPDECLDVVISSMTFHHLPIGIKKKGLDEVYRVLKKEGRFFLIDFCSPHYLTVPITYLMLIWMSSTRFQLFGKLFRLMEESDFGKVKLVKKGFFLEYYLMTKERKS